MAGWEFFDDSTNSIKDAFSHFDDNDPQQQGFRKTESDGFGQWYEGPGGESATKIGLALIAMFGPGAALFGGLGGGGGGEAAGGGGAGGGGGSWIQQAMRGGQGMLNGGGDDSSGPEYSVRRRRGIFGSDSGPLFNV